MNTIATIVRLNLSAVQRRGGEYAKALLELGSIKGRYLEVDTDEFHRISQSAPAAVAAPKPIQEWPLPIRIIARRRTAGDTGVGDTVARIIGPVGGDAFKFWFQLIIGHSCNCASRQAWLNGRWPYITPNTP